MTARLFYDTCALLNAQEKAFTAKFAVSQKTLEEVEHIKVSQNKDQETKYKARNCARLLKQHYGDYEVIPTTDEVLKRIAQFKLEETPDNIIMASALNYKMYKCKDMVFVTDDINCYCLAQSVYGLTVQSTEDFLMDDAIYKGYKKITGTPDEINDYMASIDFSEWNTNEYLIIENTADNSIKEMRFDGEKFVALKLPPSKFIKAKNALQRCALDALLNPEIGIVAILGTYGSGKTYMAMQVGLYNVQEKGRQSRILGVREVVGQGREIGYLPGDMEDKTGNFFLPLVQSLSGGEYELERLKDQGVLETNIPYFMKGTTYNNTVIICDEAEDLDEKQIRLIGTRVGENSRIYFSGDYKQSVINNGQNNALVKMCNELKGNKRFACVCLEEDVRSETSKLFAELYNNN